MPHEKTIDLTKALVESLASEPYEYTVLVSRELLPRLREWSEPVQVRITGEKDGRLEMEFRRVVSGAPENA